MKKLSTKDYIVTVFEELLQENDFESISVSDITQACDISRTTFYRYFDDKYSLMNWIYHQNKKEFLDCNKNITDWHELSINIYSFVYKKRELFRKGLNYHGQNNLYEYIYESSLHFFTELCKEKLHTEHLPADLNYSLHLYCGGTIHTLKEWVMSGAKETPETMTKYAYDNIPPVMRHYLEKEEN